MKDTIGLLHPSSSWFNDQDLRGREIEVLEIRKITPCGKIESKNWFSGLVKLVNPDDNRYDCIDNKLNIFGFRPRRIK